MKETKTAVQRRASKRIPAALKISFFYKLMFYSGVVTDVSQHGMFIRTMVHMQEGLLFPLIIRREDDVLHVLAKVRHRKKTDNLNNGVGVEIISPAGIYQRLMDDTK